MPLYSHGITGAVKCTTSAAVKYTTRFILMGSKGWSLMMDLTKGKGPKNRKYN